MRRITDITEDLLETACDICHYPFVLTSGLLRERCENCPLDSLVAELNNHQDSLDLEDDGK